MKKREEEEEWPKKITVGIHVDVSLAEQYRREKYFSDVFFFIFLFWEYL
jgi:hypothetical protein